MSQSLSKNFIIDKNNEGLRLDKFLISKGLNFSLIQKLVRKKLIKVNDQKTQISYRLNYQDKIIIFANLDFSEKVKSKKNVNKDFVKKIKDLTIASYGSFSIFLHVNKSLLVSTFA